MAQGQKGQDAARSRAPPSRALRASARGRQHGGIARGDLPHHRLRLGDEEPCGRARPAAAKARPTGLRAIRDRALAVGKAIRTSNHGNAWAIYVTDPDGDALEVFATSPYPMQQPFDLDAADTEIPAATAGLRRRCRAPPAP